MRYYLSFNNITKEYYLDSGAFSSRRLSLGREEDFLLSYLKKNINRKRNTEFVFLKEGFSSGLIKSIEKYFSDSKVKVGLESVSNYR